MPARLQHRSSREDCALVTRVRRGFWTSWKSGALLVLGRVPDRAKFTAPQDPRKWKKVRSDFDGRAVYPKAGEDRYAWRFFGAVSAQVEFGHPDRGHAHADQASLFGKLGKGRMEQIASRSLYQRISQTAFRSLSPPGGGAG